MSTISIKGLNKAAVLAALYNASRPQEMGFLQYTPEPMTVEEAQTVGENNRWSFDYLSGRVMKVNLSKDEFDPWGFDRDNGQGRAAACVAIVKAGMDENAQPIQDMHKQGIAAGIEHTRVALGQHTVVEKGGGLRLGLSEMSDVLEPKLAAAGKQ